MKNLSMMVAIKSQSELLCVTVVPSSSIAIGALVTSCVHVNLVVPVSVTGHVYTATLSADSDNLQ